MINVKSLKELLEIAGIEENKDKLNKIVERLNGEEVENIEDLRYLKESDISELFGYKKVKTAKLMEAIKKLNRKEVKIELPKMPKDFSSVKLEVTGKTKLDLESVNNFIEFAMLYGLGSEKIGDNLINLLQERMKELDEPASEKIIEVYRLVSKFKKFDENVAAVLNFELSLLPKRHIIAEKIKSNMVPAVIGFINDALNFRLSMSDFNSIILAKTLRTKKVEDVQADGLVIAAEDLAVNINKVFAGLNGLVVKEALKIYKEVFEIVNDKELQEFVGAKDTRDMMRKLGVIYSPKDVKSFELLKELIYQMLIVLENDEVISDNDMLYAYLQNVWNKSKLIDWNKLFEISGPKTSQKNITNSENFESLEMVENCEF